MFPKNKNYRFYIRSDKDEYTSFKREVQPFNIGSFEVSEKRENGQYFFRTEASDILLIDDGSAGITDYSFIRNIETGNDGVFTFYDRLIIEVYKKCGDGEQLKWSFYSYINDASFDIDRCRVTLKLLPADKYDCVLKNWDTKVNLMDIQTRKSTILTAQIKYRDRTLDVTDVPINQIPPTYRNAFFYGIIGVTDTSDPIFRGAKFPDGSYATITWAMYLRQEISLPAGVLPIGSDWVIDTEYSTDDIKVYFRSYENAFPQTIIGGCVASRTQYSNWQKLPGTEYFPVYFNPTFINFAVISELEQQIALPRGILLYDAVNYLVEQTCSDLTLSSVFFTDTVNPVAGNLGQSVSPTRNILLYQMTDVIKPTATDPASISNISLREMLDILQKMFNVFWDIREDVNYFRVEHKLFYENGLSYAGETVGFDAASLVASETGRQFIHFSNKYSYDLADNIHELQLSIGTEVPDIESNKSGTLKFLNDSTSNANILNQISNVYVDTSDLMRVGGRLNQTSLVFLSTIYDGSYPIIKEVNILTGIIELNAHLFPSNLLLHYHLYDYIQKDAVIVGYGEVSIIKAKRIKKQETIQIPYCDCVDGVFNPQELVVTNLGNGKVENTVFSLKSDLLSINLRYD